MNPTHHEERHIVAFLQLLQQLQTVSYQLTSLLSVCFSCGGDRPFFQRARRERASPSRVRGPVLDPPCMRHLPLAMAGAQQAVQIDRALAGHSYELQQSKVDDLAEPESAPSGIPEMNALTDHLFLPEKEDLDKLLRYEAMINRQLNHAMGELDRVQTRREGKADRN
jgi:hypothetical protein